jgi:DNA-binding transcriptional LysR family regulator
MNDIGAHWDLIHVFLAVCRLQKYEAAAHQLCIDSSTIRRKIQKLEALVGSPLFESRSGKLFLLQYHYKLLEAAEAMEAASWNFMKSASIAQSSGRIRLSVIDVLGHMLASDFSSYFAARTELTLDITTETHFVDLDAEKIDIAIRMARPTQGRHGLRKLGEMHFGIFGEREYLEKLEEGDAALQVLSLEPHFPHQNHDFVLAEDHWYRGIGAAVHVTGRTDNYPMLHTMCRRGMGLAMLPNFMVASDPQLKPYDAKTTVETVPIWMLIRDDLSKVPKIREFADYIGATFRKLAPVLLGDPNAAAGDRTLLWRGATDQ